jgi:hypothetical protein
MEIKSYEDWLTLPEEEQVRLQTEVWNTNSREGVAFAFIAGGRFSFQSTYKVLDIRVGMFHGGVYVFYLYVGDEDFEKISPGQQFEFEGFIGAYHPISSLFP